MTLVSSDRWRTLEQWSAIAFLVGGVLFVITAGFNAADVRAGTGHMRLPLKQAFIGFAWTAGLVGLLGVYPRLSDRSSKLAGAGAVCTVIGAVGYAAMGVVSLAYYLGIPGGEFEAVVVYFLPGVLVGTLLTFPLFSIVSFRSDIHPRTFSLLLLGPPLLFIVNVLTPTPPSVVLGVVSGLALVFFAIGHILRGEALSPDSVEPSTTPTAE